MKPVTRAEIVDYVTYGEERDAFRTEVLALKAPRRIHVGEALTFLFENRATVRYQVQEMMRTEQIVKEADILHELATYNELVGGEGELGCTLLIEIEDPAARAEKLRAWLELPRYLYALLESGERARFSFDERQVGEERLSSVQYLKVKVGKAAPVALGCDHPALSLEVQLSDQQRRALSADLGS
jgi:hypothetical protein